jgi:hypothetical protein
MTDRRSNSPTTREQKARNRALHVLARMRRTGDSLTAAAREEHIDSRTVKKYLAADLKRIPEGYTGPTKADRRLRNMVILTPRGTANVTIRGSEQASQLGHYFSAVGTFLRSGSTDALKQFDGQSLAGHRLITDPETLQNLARAGALHLDQIYAVSESPNDQ